MSRLPNLNARKILRALKHAGFIEDGQRGSHLYLWNEEKKLVTSVPMHGRDVKRSLLKQIVRQAGLTEDEFRKLL